MSPVFRYCYVTVIFVIEKLDTDLVIIMNLILVCRFFSTDWWASIDSPYLKYSQY